MSEQKEIENAFPDSESIAIDDYAKNSYLNYSMYVILDRALPFIGDGLKPVHRRIIYAMNQLRLNPQGQYKKAARTVGDVLGKYHPHGDCLWHNTTIPLLNGQYKTIGELVKDGYGELDVLAYDKTNEKLIPAKAYAWRVGQTTKKMIEVTLTSGEKYRTTHNHQYFTHNHGEVAAEDLTNEMSLVGGFINNKEYKSISFNVGSDKNLKKLHKLIGESIHGKQNGDFIFHHKDENRHNNSPSNIELTNRQVHPLYHKEDYEKGLKNGRISMFSENSSMRNSIKTKNQILMKAYNKDQGLYKAYRAIDYLVENNKELSIENYNGLRKQGVFYNLTTLETIEDKYNLNFDDLVNKERKTIDTQNSIGLTKEYSNNSNYRDSNNNKNNHENGSLHKAIGKTLNELLQKYHIDDISWEVYEKTANQFTQWNKNKTVFNSRAKLAERGWNTTSIRELAKQVYTNYLCHVTDVEEVELEQEEDFYDFTVDGYQNMIVCASQDQQKNDKINNFIVVHNSSCYGAMVKMAQPFSTRYPLVDGQGNWGSIDDPNSFAAMRYTEAKLAPYSTSLLTEMEKSVVDWAPNFDGSLEEPLYLPAQLPNIIINGTSGIAVGMATDIVPHNINEIAKACTYLIKNPNAKTATLTKYVNGPDFPTGGQIATPTEEIEKIYETGRGSIRLRAQYELENNEIVIKEVPADTSTSKLLMNIGDMINNKKLPLVEDIRDEGDKNEPTRLVIVPKKKTDPDKVMEHLFATTELEKNIKVNMNMICLDKKPRVLGLKDILNEWLSFRRDVITRRFQALLERTQHRIHLLEGYEKVLASLDKVIEIIRFAEKPLNELMEKIDLTEVQANHILETRIRSLSKLDDRVKDEKGELQEREAYCNKILSDSQELDNVMRKEIQEAAKKYGDSRRTLIEYADPPKAISEEQMMPSEKTTVVVSEKGWIRASKGSIDGKNLSYKNGDQFLASAEGMSNDIISIIDIQGKVYNIAYKDIPGARGYGEPLTSKINIGSTPVFDVVIAKENDSFVYVASSGYGFYFNGSDLETKMKAGKKMFSLKDNETIHSIQKITNANQICLATQKGKVIAFDINECQYRAKGRGIQLMKVNKDDYLSQVILFHSQNQLKLGNKIVDDTTWQSIWGSRGRSGKTLLSQKQSVTIKDQK